MGTELDNSLLEDILAQVRPLIGRGKVADYIPALAEVSPDHLGIAVCTTKGEIFRAGDADMRFSIQSISKVLSLTLALTRYQESEIWQRVGKEPSGQPFNSLVQLELEQENRVTRSSIRARWWSAICCKPGSRHRNRECWKWCVSWPDRQISTTIGTLPVQSSTILTAMRRLPI